MSEYPHIQHLASAEEEDCLRPDQLEGFVAGKLAGDEKAYAERHVRNCELCAMTVESMGEMNAASLEAGAAAISEAAWDRIAVQEKKRRAGAWVWISAAASVMLVAVVGFFMLRGPGEQVKMDELAEGLYEAPPAPNKAPANTSGGFNFQADSLKSRTELANGSAMEMARPVPRQDLQRLDSSSLKSQLWAEGGVDRATTRNVEDIEREVDFLDKDFKQPADPAPVATGKADFGFQNEAKNNAPAVAKMEVAPSEDLDDDFADFAVTGNVSQNQVMEKEMDEEEAVNLDEVVVTADKKEPKLNIVIDGGEITAARDVPRMEQSTSSTVVVESRSVGRSPRTREGKRRKKNKQDQKGAVADQTVVETKEEVNAGYKGEPGNGSLGDVVSDSVAISTGDISIFDQGLDAYRQGEYQRSADLLRQAAAATPANLQAHYYAAASFMNIDQPQAAVYHLNRVLAVPGNALYQDAQWYKALAYLKLNARNKAKALLEKIEAAGGKHAKPARKALKEF